MIRRSATIAALALMLMSSACGPGSKEAGSNTTKPSGDALANKTELEAAFAAAFPHGATVQSGDTKLTYEAKQLVPISADIEALVAEGTAEDACHACLGALKIVYLSRAGGGLAPVGKKAGWDIDGDGFGAAPDWSVSRTSGAPVLTVKTSGTNQGCTTTALNVYHLEPHTVRYDAAASKGGDESSCEGADNSASSDNETGSETDSRVAAEAGAEANKAAFARDHSDQALPAGANRTGTPQP